MTKPEVSVIVPVYNRSKMIKDCIESLIDQKTKFSYEILLSDDSSTDDTPEVLKEYQRKHRGLIRIFRTKKNVGAGGARNLAIDNAKGKVIAFIDSDCIAEKNWLSTITKDIMNT